MSPPVTTAPEYKQAPGVLRLERARFLYVLSFQLRKQMEPLFICPIGRTNSGGYSEEKQRQAT